MPMSSVNTSAFKLTGTGSLDFVRSGSRTVVARSVAHSPLKLLNPQNHGRAAWVFSSSYGGGLLGGDRLAIDVNVSVGAAAMLSTQSSTKVYRSELPAAQELHAMVEDQGLLVLAPDPVVCFADSEYTQRQTIHLMGSGGLVLVDWLSAGRQAYGERWAFRRFASRTDVIQNGKKILHDALQLDPENGSIAGQLGRFNILATAIVCGPVLLDSAKAMVDEINREPLGRNMDLVQSAGLFQNAGAILRIAGTSVEQTGRLLRQRLSFVCACLGEDPWARKW